jgi:hypothetical protein
MLKHLNDDPEPSLGDFDELGVTRYFGRGDMSGKNLLSGWAEPETNHNWNEGPEAILLLRLPELPEEPCTLAIEGRPYIATGLPRQDITLFVNGYRISFWRLLSADRIRLEAEIEPEMWLNRRGGALARCVWHLPDSTRPIDISDAQDERQIGFCFQSLLLQPRRPRLARMP